MLKNSEKLSPYDYQKIPLTGSVMRNSRLRIFLYVLLAAAMCCVVYLLNTTHSRFKEIESLREKCLQQRDSLSAQLQVVYEHKNRLEKSLQQEKIDHKHTKEEQDRQKNEIRVRMEREKHTLESRYSNLLQEHEASQNKQQQLNNEITEMKSNYALLEDEKKQLVGALTAQLETLKQQKEEETNKLKADINQLILEKEDLHKNIENQIWRVKQHTDELQLCRMQYDQMEDRLKQLTSQIQRRPPNDDKNINIVHHQDSKGLKDEQFNELHPSQTLQEIQQLKNKNEIKSEKVNKIAQDIENKDKENDDKANKEIINNDEQVMQPKLLQRPNLISSIKAQEPSPNPNLNIHHLQNEQHELERPQINIPNNFIEEKKKEVEIEPKIQDSVLHPPIVGKLSDIQQNEEHLPQVQPPHSFNKAEVDGDKWDRYPKNADDFEQYHVQNPINNNVLHQPLNVKDLEIQNEKQQAADDIQERGVLIKPPLDNHHQEKKIGHDVEGLKRGPQMIDEKNGKHRQQEEDGDYAEDGDDDNADDQDGEPNNDDDQLMVGDHAVHANAFKDADFDDQDNADAEDKNVVNQDKEEGVMVAPK